MESEKSITPEDLLPVELWIKIINKMDHFPIQMSILQNVCQLFWNIIQEEFVAKGKLKSDLYEIRRPFTDNNQNNENNANFDDFFVFLKEDKLTLNCSRPCWLLGVGFHGPYSSSQNSIKNLKITLAVKLESITLNQRQKLCRVKFPEVIQPIFFERPTVLESKSSYTISMEFDFNSTESNINEDYGRAYMIEYQGRETIKSEFNEFHFDENKCLRPDSSCKCAYVQCGHIRVLYFWPC